MKKIIFPMLVLPLIALCFSMNLQAQSSETDLDQVELMKQFIGKWITETGEDTTLIWEVIPSNKGYESNISWQAKGETYLTTQGILGFARGKQLVSLYHLWPEGGIGRDIGEFVSDNKMITERYAIEPKHVMATMEFNFITPDKFKEIVKGRGMKETWEDAVVTEYIWTRVKK